VEELLCSCVSGWRESRRCCVEVLVEGVLKKKSNKWCWSSREGKKSKRVFVFACKSLEGK